MFNAFVNNRISAALSNQDINALRRWLAVANGGTFEPHCWAYSYKGLSLPEMAMKASNYHLDRYKKPSWLQSIFQLPRATQSELLLSQDYIATLHACWQATKALSTPEPIQLRWYQQLINWIIRPYTTRWTFDAETPFEDNTLKSVLTTHLPHDEVDHIFTTKQTPIIDAQSLEAATQDNTATDDPLAEHWSTDIAISFIHNIDQQHQHRVEQRHEHTIAVNLNKHQNTDARVQFAVDQSTGLDFESVHMQFQGGNSDPTHAWLRSFEEAIPVDEKEHPSSYPRQYTITRNTVCISEAALSVLKKGKGNVRGDFTAVSLDELPLGFFIDSQSIASGYNEGRLNYTLKFSADYRLYQLDTLADAGLRLDPYLHGTTANDTHYEIACQYHRAFTVKQQLSSFWWDDVVIKAENTVENKQSHYSNRSHLMEKLNAKGIQLSDNEQSFLNINSNQWPELFKYISYFNQPKNPFNLVVYALAIIDEQSTPDQFKAFLHVLMQLNNRFFTNCFNNNHTKLLHVFSPFLFHLADGTEFNGEKQKAALERLLKMDDLELSWFYLLSCREIRGITDRSGTSLTVPDGYHANLLELTSGLFYFLDYFKAKKLPLPNTLDDVGPIYQYTGITHLKGILDCISLSPAPFLQAKIMGKIPLDTTHAVKQLRSGYCIVHIDMQLVRRQNYILDNYLQKSCPAAKNSDSYLITKEQLETVAFYTNRNKDDNHPPIWFYKAIFLRYLACHVDASHVLDGINTWERLIPEKSVYDSNYDSKDWERLKPIWDNLLAEVFTWPSRLDRQQHANDPYTPEAFVQEKVKQEILAKKRYDLADLTRLPIPALEKDALMENIHALNDMSVTYDEKSADALKCAIEDCKTDLECGRLTIVGALALLREVVYRQSGEQVWLRLEQVVIVLMSLTHDRLYQVETSEGKTVLLQMVALLRALQHKKVDIITHNEKLASDAFNLIRPLASLFHLQISSKNSLASDIVNADIHYIDAPTTVINYTIATFVEPSAPSNTRSADFALVDEVDNIVIDIHASTTMQISVGGSSQADLEIFLMRLNEAMSALKALPIDALSHPKSKQEQRDYIRQAVYDLTFYRLFCEHNETHFDEWIRAAYVRSSLKKDEHYMIETDAEQKKHIRIVHVETTGRVDKVSQWGLGVHQCIAAFEKNVGGDQAIQIPTISTVIAEGDIAHYLQQYPARSGYTGSLGDKAVLDTMESVLHVTAPSIIMPRAKKEAPADVSWPELENPDAITKPIKQYNRGYHFTPHVLETRDAHLKHLITALWQAQEKELSTLIFFNTISDCNLFCDRLLKNGITGDHIQILDDQNPSDDKALSADCFHPTEAAVIQRAGDKRMITLATAAGGRGTDFNQIDIAIITDPRLLDRVLHQAKGRVGRNLDRGVTYEIYCKDDIVKQATPDNLGSNPVSFFNQINDAKIAKQAKDLNQIKRKAPLQDYKQGIQHAYKSFLLQNTEDKETIRQAWPKFLRDIDRYWDYNQDVPDNLAIMQTRWENYFKDTSWQLSDSLLPDHDQKRHEP